MAWRFVVVFSLFTGALMLMAGMGVLVGFFLTGLVGDMGPLALLLAVVAVPSWYLTKEWHKRHKR